MCVIRYISIIAKQIEIRNIINLLQIKRLPIDNYHNSIIHQVYSKIWTPTGQACRLGKLSSHVQATGRSTSCGKGGYTVEGEPTHRVRKGPDRPCTFSVKYKYNPQFYFHKVVGMGGIY